MSPTRLVPITVEPAFTLTLPCSALNVLSVVRHVQTPLNVQNARLDLIVIMLTEHVVV